MVGSEYTVKTGGGGGGGGGGGNDYSPRNFFLREFFSRALLSERLDQAPG